MYHVRCEMRLQLQMQIWMRCFLVPPYHPPLILILFSPGFLSSAPSVYPNLTTSVSLGLATSVFLSSATHIYRSQLGEWIRLASSRGFTTHQSSQLVGHQDEPRRKERYRCPELFTRRPIHLTTYRADGPMYSTKNRVNGNRPICSMKIAIWVGQFTRLSKWDDSARKSPAKDIQQMRNRHSVLDLQSLTISFSIFHNIK